MKKIIFSLLTLVLAVSGGRLSICQAQDQSPAATGSVLICGDSLMKLLAVSLERELARRDVTNVTSFASIGSGLVRLDLLDWHAKLQSLIEAQQPAVAVLLLGSNDNQPMQDSEQRTLQQGTETWETEYRLRAQTCLDILRKGGVDHILWLGLPDMRDAVLQQHADKINRILQTVLTDDGCHNYFDTQSFLSRTAGQFSSYILNDQGMPIHVRAADGIHFSRPGADLLARELGRRIINWLPTAKETAGTKP